MSTNWTHLLEQAGTETFVGRQYECRRFDEFLDGQTLRMLHVHGPAGIGKTALLECFGREAKAKQWQLLHLDGAAIEPVATSLEQAFEPALDAIADTKMLVTLDNFGDLGSLHRWMRQKLLTRLAASVRLVTASRQPLADEWLTAPGWEQLVTSLKLDNLSEGESLELLELRGVDGERRAEVADFAKGHPLALAVAADVVTRHPDQPFCYEAAADDLQLLLRRLLDEAPSEEHRDAMRLASLVRRTTEPLLADVLDVDHASKLLRWLAARPFFNWDEQGFFPHDLVRQLLNDEMRRFEQSTRSKLLRGAMNFYFAQGQVLSGSAYEEIMIDLGYLLRDELLSGWAPIEAQKYDLDDAVTEEEMELCVETVGRFEGDESAELVRYWQEHQPDGLVVFRDPDGKVAGFCHFLELDRVEPQARQIDPALEIICDYIDQTPLREGETARMCRFWMATDTYQEWSGVQTRMFLHIFHQIAASAGVAVGPTVHSYPEKWLSRPDNQLRSLGEFELDGIPFVVLGRDWRKVRRIDWLRGMVQAMMGQPQITHNPTPAVLPRDEFLEAVKRALKHFHRGDRLEANPLVSTPLVLARCQEDSSIDGRVEALRELLEETCHSLGETGGDRRHVEVLDHAYLRSDAKKQQAIADELGMAYSTFRYHLAHAVDRVAEQMWKMEQALVDV